MEEILEFLRENVFFVATVDGDQPRVRPFGAPLLYEGELYLFTGQGKNVYNQMLANPLIEVAGINDDGEWLRLTAEAEVVLDDDIVAAFLEDDPTLKEYYAVGDGHAAPVRLKVLAASMNSEEKGKREII